MNNKNLEKIFNVYGDFIESRLEEGYKQYSKTQDYDKHQKQFLESIQILLKNISEDKLQQFENVIYKLNTIEVNYSYLQGFIDGVLLRETRLGHIKNQNLEKIFNICGDFIESKLKEGYKQYSKTQYYKKHQKEYSELKQILLKDISEDKLEQFENSIYKLNSIEVKYAYLQGFIDGILLRETLNNK